MRTLTRHPLTLVELIAVIVVILVVAVLLVPEVFMDHSRERARRVNCAGNLKQIGLSLLMYSGDSWEPPGKDPVSYGWFPPNDRYGSTNFEPLVRAGYMQNGKVWACPSRSEVLTTGANSAYRYVGSGLKDDNANATGVSLAYDVSGNHPDNAWMNALFVDGHVEGGKPGSKPMYGND